MTITKNKTHYLTGLVSLYHLLIHADGYIDEKELKMGDLMKKYEKIDDLEFDYYHNIMGKLNSEQLIKKCIKSLNKCDYEWKIRCIAWMSLIANIDGFMDPEEWKLLYYIYHTELELDLADILEMQRNLPRVS